jgi:hypothetical protein
MTIDENYTERLANAVAKTLLEALENLTITDVNMYRLGYNKAIDDFFKKIMKYCSMSNMNATMIRQIAEQLKKGDADNE